MQNSFSKILQDIKQRYGNKPKRTRSTSPLSTQPYHPHPIINELIQHHLTLLAQCQNQDEQADVLLSLYSIAYGKGKTTIKDIFNSSILH
jgi:hypothetical protein